MLFATHSSPFCDSSVVLLVSSVCRPPFLQDAKVEVVSCQRQDEAPGEEVPHEEPGDSVLERADYLTGTQDLGCQQAQTPEGLNGGSEHSPSLKGVWCF